MAELEQSIDKKIEETRREIADAREQEKTYRSRADAAARKAAERETFLAGLEQWKRQLAGSSPPPPPQSQVAHDEPVPIRAMVGEALKVLETFSNMELFNHLREQEPNTNKNSVYSEINHRYKKGDITRIETGFYRSNLYEGTVEEQTKPVTIQKEGDGFVSSEPPVGFGQDSE